MTTQFDRIYHGLSPEVGKFRVAASGMAWKGVESEGVVAMSSGDIKWAQWLRVARGFQLRVGLANHKRETFDGFEREDHDKIANLLKKSFTITLETKETTFKGWNWGVADFQGPDLAFTISDKTAFELPLSLVANSNIASKTEVALELSAPSGSRSKGVDELVEIRFYVPGTQSKAKGSDAGSQKSDDENEDETSAAQAFHDLVKEKASIGDAAGDIVLSFEEVLVLTPRGRYDIDLFKEHLRLHGKTYDYKIAYTSISRMFLLSKDEQSALFIVGLTTPIGQGQTRYQYLVMQFMVEEEISAELNMTEEEVAQYDKLKKSYEDSTYQVMSSVFRALSGKKIIGAGSFQSHEQQPGFKANLKAVQGDLFILEKYVFFVSKQPTLIEISDIHQVVFSRVGGAVRTFDMKIITRSGPEYQFTSISKEEHEGLETYLKEKKVKVKNEMVPDAEMLLAAAVGDDDDDDEDMQSVSSDDGRSKKPKPAQGNDDSSEEDEDFEASSSDSGSPSESDSSEGGAATASDASGDRDFSKPKTKKPKKKKAKDGEGKPNGPAADSDAEDNDKPKKKKKAKAKGDDAMDVDGADSASAPPRPKPKPKPKPKKPDESMDVDPKPKSKADDDEPPKKKLKT